MNSVTQILKAKGNQIWTVSIEMSVLDALKIMADHQVGSVIVMDGDQVVGIFTERDYAHKVGLLDIAPSTVKISDVVTRDLITVKPEDTVSHCMVVITENHIRHLPVMKDNQIVGLVSIGDVVKDIIEELQFAITQLENYITYFR